MGKQKTQQVKKVASKGATKATKKVTPNHKAVGKNFTTFLNKWGFIRIPKALQEKLPFKVGEELEIAIGAISVTIWKVGKTPEKVSSKTYTTTIKAVKEGEEFKKCEKHDIEYSDYCPKCKAEEQKEVEVPAK